MLWTDKAAKYLKKYWKIDQLKDKQIEVINELLSGSDVIGLLPTGYGKSMCYLIPPLVTKKVIFIISPLISLMDDQKDKLVQMGIPCAALHGNNANRNDEVAQVKSGLIRIIYMSPEYLINSDAMQLAETLDIEGKLGFLAVDESHCISSWGHDFRPEYKMIKTFRENFPHIPILAVTATATDIVCRDIAKNLALQNPVLIRASFDRPNLYISVKNIPTNENVGKRGGKSKGGKGGKQVSKEMIVIPYIKKYPNEKIIIYTGSRKETEDLAEKLNKVIPNISQSYHAGMNKKTRETIQSKFSSGEVKVIVSTIAFGMGIDQIVRCVLIFGCPSSIEEYYQQIGRGGRDGEKCETVLYYDHSKLFVAKYMMRDIKMKQPTLYRIREENLNKVTKFAYLGTCRRKYILEYFNEECLFFNCMNCDNCCELGEYVDMTDQIKEILFKKTVRNMNMISLIHEIKTNYMANHEIDLMGALVQWKRYVENNNMVVPDKMRIYVPKKFLKSQSPVSPTKSMDEKKTNIMDQYLDKIEEMDL
jgi:ATP-dependent DNA helicase RecQ